METQLYNFAKAFRGSNPFVGEDYIRYNSNNPKRLAKDIEYFAAVNGFDITVKPDTLFRNVLVKLAPDHMGAVIVELDKLQASL